MLIIPVKKGNIHRVLKQFKKKFRNTKVLQEIRNKKEFKKKSFLKRQVKEKAILRDKYRRNNDE